MFSLGFFNEFIQNLSSRRVIFFISILISVIAYQYVTNYLVGDRISFLNKIFSSVIPTEDTYNFFSGDATGGEFSIYHQIGDEIRSNGRIDDFIISSLGSKNSALSNAFGVLNNPNSFGIIQSDTYLQAPFINDPDKVKIITSLYMERLHLLVKKPSGLTIENELLSNTNPSLIALVNDALKSERMITGGPTSSARNYMHFVFDQVGIEYKKNYDKIRYGSYEQIFEFLDRSEPKGNEIALGIFTLGIHPKIENLLRSEEYILIGIDPIAINTINKEFNQKMETSYFDGNYEFVSGKPTIGAYATLIASADVSNQEILNFLKLFSNIDSRYKRLFKDPPISIAEVKSYYETLYNEERIGTFGSFLIFFASIITSTFLVTNFIMWFTSNFKKAKYYRVMIKDYNGIVDVSKQYSVTEAKIENLTSGMDNLNLLAGKIRKDFETGGMTNSDHQYLMINLDNIYDFYRERLTQRVNDRIESFIQDPKQASIFKNNLLEEVSKLYSKDFLKISEYGFLYDKIDSIK